METQTVNPESELIHMPKAIIAEDADKYLQLVKDKNRLLESLIEAHYDLITMHGTLAQKDKAINDLTSQLLKGSTKLNVVTGHLSTFLDEFEAAFDNDETCESSEIAQNYIDAAKYMADNFGRINNRIWHVEEWLNNYLPFNINR